MAEHNFKTAGILRAAFDYQDLIGIEVLIRFYRDPKLFHWVELESNEPQAGKLDDVVAARQDGSYELYQVKFSVDPSEYQLDWDWLLTRKPKGTSLIQKWAGALKTVVSLGPVHTAKLRTNRLPDSNFQQSLIGNLVDFDKIDDSRKSTLVTELGSEAEARSFFQQFEFSHSEPLIDDLGTLLKGQIVPSDTDTGGWLLLNSQASRWASRKNQPEPDGKIRHEHLVQIISKRRPKPIPQEFTIPDSYHVPSESFHKNFLARVSTGTNPISVLWGSPGRGKSTYLSYLVRWLRDEGLPVARHHYFLSLDDSTVDRVSYSDISHSLMDQIRALYPDAVRNLKETPDQLRPWLEACGKHFASESKPFFLVIDGLDHVWREQQNTSQMEHLFNHLLPCPPNVYLLVGTQRVPTSQLPLKLVQDADEDDWIEVPSMDRSSVHAWIAGQYKSGRLLLRETGHPPLESELADVSAAFYEICAGNPLHLIYSFEALVRRGAIVLSDDVLEMPSCPEGDIREYYKLLWARLSGDARKVLHTIAGCDFCWPSEGLQRCVGSVHEVDHLLEHRRTGLTPFHGSVLAFARDQPDHKRLLQSSLPSVIHWLENDASDFLNWGWLWIMRSSNGDHNSLLNGVTRDWVIESLAAGWPIDQIVTILHTAEEIAFSQDDLISAWQIRSLKTRAQNGPEYQINRYGDFQECAVRLSKNEQQIMNMADGLPLASDDEIITLSRCLRGIDLDGIGGECFKELRGQVNHPITSKNPLNDQYFATVEKFFEAMADFGTFDPERLFGFICQFNQRNRLFHTFTKHAVRTSNFDAISCMLSYLNTDDHAEWRSAAESATVRIAGHECIDLQTRMSPTENISPLLSCWYRLQGYPPPQPCTSISVPAAIVNEDYPYGPNPEIERFLHSQFFLAFDAALEGKEDYSPALEGVDQSKMGWIGEALEHLKKAAFSFSKDRDEMGFAALFVGLSELNPVDTNRRPSDPDSAQYRAFRSAVGDIALDLHALRCSLSGPSMVQPEDFKIARGSVHWVDDIWIAHELETRRRWVDPKGVETLVKDMASTASKYVTSFNERADRWIDLAQLSTIYGLDGGHEHVRRAATCLIGYGWRKDMWIFEVLSAVEYVHEMTGVDVQPWLERLAPIVEEITNFTDGDETNGAPKDFVELVSSVHPEWLPPIYAHRIAREEYDLAERTLAAILEHLDYSDAASVALANSLVDGVDLKKLENLQQAGHSGVAAILRKRKEFLGIDGTRDEAQFKKGTGQKDDFERGGKSPDITKFGPDDLEKLLKRVNRGKIGYKRREECLASWLQHWAENGRGLEVLDTIDRYFTSNDNPLDIQHLLDTAFDISLKLEGRNKAYKWIVRAHAENHGWASFWSDRETIPPRLKLVAKHYKDRWKEYIRDTSTQTRFWEKRHPSFVIGSEWLVMFLILVGQEKLAVELVDTFVQMTIDSLSDQPISVPAWVP